MFQNRPNHKKVLHQETRLESRLGLAIGVGAMLSTESTEILYDSRVQESQFFPQQKSTKNKSGLTVRP